VLAGVLLNVIEAAWPIYSSPYGGSNPRRAPLDDVQYAVVLVVDTLEDPFAIERSGVARLAATGWIKRGPIECHRGPTTDAIGLVCDERFELD
jgi:hypothetical protein